MTIRSEDQLSTEVGGTAKKPTIRNVAERAGVSKSLVSLVIRGAPNVSDAKRKAVLQAAADLGWRPNLAARSLSEQRSRALGVLLSDLHNPFCAEIVDGIIEEAEGKGLITQIGTGRRHPGEEEQAIELFLQQNVEGLILVAPVAGNQAIAAAAAIAPTVIIAQTDLNLPQCDFVNDDDEAGAELVISHLTELGHTRIGFIAARRGRGGDHRLGGYQRAMRAHGLEGYIQVAEGGDSAVEGYRGAQELLASRIRPTAIFAFNDFAALGALSAIVDAELRVPEDVSVVGYDNTTLAAAFPISLTSVDQPRLEMGRLAVQAISERLERGASLPSRHTQLHPRLVVRKTTSRCSESRGRGPNPTPGAR